MLDFGAANKVVSDIEAIPMQRIHETFELLAPDERHRFVIDMASLR